MYSITWKMARHNSNMAQFICHIATKFGHPSSTTYLSQWSEWRHQVQMLLTSFFVKCARKVETGQKMRAKNLREMLYWKLLEYLFARRTRIKQVKVRAEGWNRSKNARQKSQGNVVLQVVGFTI